MSDKPRKWCGRALRALALVLPVALAAPASVGLASAADIPGSTHDYPIVREGDPGLADHTILRPGNLDSVDFRMPIVVWGDGGCRDSNQEYNYFLTHFAAYGYFIVADGPPGNPYNPSELTGLLDPQPQKLIAGINWAIAQDANPQSPYYQRLDPQRIVVMGQSCGGWEGTDASADPRVTTSVIWDSGFDPYSPADVTGLHAPVLYAYGGVTDYANWDAIGAYEATTAPTVLADNTGAGHTGMWDDPSPPAQPPGQYQNNPLLVGSAWLDFTLYGDSAARAFFLGSPCGLCSRPGWTVQSKNWDHYAGPPPPAQAPGPSAAPVAASRPAAAAVACIRIVVVRLPRTLRSAVVFVDGHARGRLRSGDTRRLRLQGVRAVVRVVGRTRADRARVFIHRYRLCAGARG